MINESLSLRGHLCLCQHVRLCVLVLLTQAHAGCTVQTSQSRRNNLSAVHVLANYQLLNRVVRKTCHTHRQGPKSIMSTMESVKREVYPSHFLLSGNGTQSLVVIASLCQAESRHILMNAAICLHKQLLRVYQSKLLYLEWTWPHQWQGFVNKPLSI